MNYKNLALICILMLGYAASAAKPDVTPIKCSVSAKNKISVPSSKLKFELSNDIISGMEKEIVCKTIKWGGHSFIGVEYWNHENVTQSEKPIAVKQYEVFQLSEKQVKPQFVNPVSDYEPVWMEFRSHLIMRNRGIGTDGKPVWVDGYIYLPSAGYFEDLTTHAMDKNWSLEAD